jgi:hypothetical protein
VVNLVRGFPSHCGKPIGFSIVAALSMPRSEGEKGEQKSGGYAALKRKSPPPFPPSRPQAIPAAADFLFGTFSFVRW